MTTADGRSGSTVGKYRLHEIVGRGGMGVVYRAEHVYIGREVAVKILHEGYGGREESIKRFLREARAATLINHPNIVEVTDFGKANDGTVFFVMELLVGEPLDNILARERRLDLLRSITICNQLAAALAAAHGKNIIHRDLKPENVMLIPREGRRELVRRVADESGAYELSEREKQFDFVKILDFGVAKVREPEAQREHTTKAGVVFGTPEYMAPETARVGYSDARSDIYALGIMFYEMMTGTVPFTGETPVEVMMKQVNERVPPMHEVAPEAEVTPDAERMILKALAKDPELRHQSMEEFHRDLQKCYGQLRFRRTVKTPSVNTPPATTIPLTKKKKPGPPGAIPNVIATNGSSVEFEIAPVRPRAPTPPLPGLPLGATVPILLTRKKSPRQETPEAERTNMGMGAPASSQSASSLTDEPWVRPIGAMGPSDDRGSGASVAPPSSEPAPSPSKRKRTTLPLGLNQNNDRVTPPAAQPIPRTPGPEGYDVDIAPVMIALATRSKDREEPPVPAMPERITPRVSTPVMSMASGGGLDDRRWHEEPTSPAVEGYPGHTGKAGKTG
jgi:serine/threonine protein kinase